MLTSVVVQHRTSTRNLEAGLTQAIRKSTKEFVLKVSMLFFQVHCVRKVAIFKVYAKDGRNDGGISICAGEVAKVHSPRTVAIIVGLHVR